MPLIESNPQLLSAAPVAPAWSRVRSLVVDGVASSHSKRAYGRALDEFFDWYQQEQPGPLCKAVVQHYKASVLEGRGLAASSINASLAALRKLAGEAADNGLLEAEVARAIGKVKGAKAQGARLGNWLSREQAQALLDMPDRSTLRGLRDSALLAVLLGAGLRRAEAAGLRVDHLQQREGRWVIVDLLGKGGRVRSVPIAAWVKASIDRWLNAAGIEDGYVVRPVNKGARLGGERVSEAGIYAMLKTYAEIAPHDLRRSFAQMARKSGCAIEQIQLSLGHTSISTTEKYLGSRQDLANSPSDHIRLQA
jgi:site-specific recombinase XerD